VALFEKLPSTLTPVSLIVPSNSFANEAPTSRSNDKAVAPILSIEVDLVMSPTPASKEIFS
jgi:hypothetical protein